MLRTWIIAVGLMLMSAVSANADLMGTTMTMSVTHAGAFSGISALNNVTYTYGNASTFTVPGWGSLGVTSPETALAQGLDNSLKLDFTNFKYSAFTGMFATTGTIKLTNIAEPVDLSTVRIFVNGNNIASGVGAVGSGFQASWSTQTVYNANPTNPILVVAWNSAPVPAPGALALLGLAGLMSRRRRQR
jgi:MYXO-CTERM domain-containing protein